jgi:hypothetical protein
MRKYLEQLTMPLLSVHPLLSPGDDGTIMDLVELPEEELGYSVLTIQLDRFGRPRSDDNDGLRRRAAGSRLVYGEWTGRPLAVA